MFEQSVVEVRALAARPWTVLVSLAGQVMIISAAVLVPLLYPETLQRAAFWIPVTGPPRAYRPPAPANVELARTMAPRRVVNLHTLFEPQAFPAKPAILQDEPAVQTGGASTPCVGCVIGGIDDPGPVSATIAQLVRPVQPPPPAPAQTAPSVKPPPPPKQVPVSSGVQAAMLIHGPQPVYPALARQARISGVVQLAAVIGADGRILRLRATSGHPLLVGAAMDAVRQWVYRPTLLSGTPVEVVTEITVTFKLN